TAPNLQRAVAIGLSRDAGYFHDLAASLAARCRMLSGALRELGFAVLPASGGYFVVAGIEAVARPGETDAAFCRRMTVEGGVAAIPVSAFYGSPDAPDRYVRFAFCKREEVLREAIARLSRFLGREAARPAAVGD
ncbi:MAG: aminotransferase class I/II-fold pyridoxal phosphate-dependent enzyme, partial [Gluconacetobacter diazotrophicus]|nr:aminotransferase class I/II-fold pyridoxal phosphate-dependent enzyme [Gluconacetobacter diazotrophicus]